MGCVDFTSERSDVKSRIKSGLLFSDHLFPDLLFVLFYPSIRSELQNLPTLRRKRFFPHRNLVSRLPAYPHGQGRSRKDFFRIIISFPRSPHAAPRTGCVPRPHANPVDPAAQRAGVPVGTEFPSEKKLWHVGPAFQARFCHGVLRWPRGSAPSLEGGGRLRKGCVPARPKISYALNSHFGGCLLGRILFHFHSYV